MGIAGAKAQAGIVFRLDVGNTLLGIGEGDIVVASGIRFAAVLLAAGQYEAAEQGKGKGVLILVPSVVLTCYGSVAFQPQVTVFKNSTGLLSPRWMEPVESWKTQ